MSVEPSDISAQLHAKLEEMPPRFRAMLLRLVRSSRVAVEEDKRWLATADAVCEGWSGPHIQGSTNNGKDVGPRASGWLQLVR